MDRYLLIIKKLKSFSNPKNVIGMARFGINPKGTLGVNLPVLRKIAKEIGKDHDLALKLWRSRIHEARILACLIDKVEWVKEKQIEEWVKDFDSWDVCDAVCLNLFCNHDLAISKCYQWSKRKKEFEKRASFALMAALAVHRKDLKNTIFLKCLPIIEEASNDDRNYVRKAVNWALRQIGKRNLFLRDAALKTAKKILKRNTKSALWIAKDAIRELETDSVLKRLREKDIK